MKQIHGARAIVKCLEREGIELVLGIPGLYNMPIFDALYRHPTIRTITVRHEQGAAFMADGYARATGKPAAILTLPGPGLTNAMTGIGEAYYDSSPMLILSTQVNRDFIDQDRGLLHEMTGQFEMLAKLTKCGERITDGADIAPIFHRAMKALRSGRPRPVQIEIPRDIQVEMVPWSDEDTEPLSEPTQQQIVTAQISAAAAALSQAKRPLLYAGGGAIASGASPELVSLAERLGAPVLTTGMGVGAIPSDHPLWCGVPWIAGGANVADVVAACDAFLAVGTRFNQGMTADWSLPLPETTIRIDIDADEIERNIPMQQKIVSDAKCALAALNSALEQLGVNRDSQVDATLAQAQQAFKAGLTAKIGRTERWARALRQALPHNAILSCDMTLFWADMLSIFPIYEPRTMLFPWGFGTLGFGLPEALGAKLGCPEKPVVAIVGDGALLFTGGELATAVQYNLNIPIIVPNNNAYSMIKVQQRDQYDGQFMAVDLVNPDLLELASAFGTYGERVTRPDGLKDVLARALTADKPTLIEIPWGWTWGIES
ncbi:thiamine pyrophosphate-binding protein [Chloroflexi bacterium TSY]|nr:thiamine pyrophosphate-binding protein [Chloroflexi bacterium TSY]